MIGAFTKMIIAISSSGANRNTMNNGYFRRGVSQDTQRFLQHRGGNKKEDRVYRSTLSQYGKAGA